MQDTRVMLLPISDVLVFWLVMEFVGKLFYFLAHDVLSVEPL